MKKYPKLDKVKYLAMPISVEEKLKWNSKGYKVLDAKYDPEPQKPKRKAKAEKPAEVGQDTAE